MFKVRVTTSFKDMESPKKEIRQPGNILTIETPERLRVLMGDNKRKIKFVELLSVKKQCPTTNTNKKIIIFQDYLYFIGGIETFLFNLTKKYRNYDITIRCRNIEIEQAIILSKYCNVEIDDDKKFECDILILGNYNCDYVFNRVKAGKVYQMIHADWEDLTKLPAWSNFKWTKHPKIDKIICVSEIAAKGLKNTMGYDGEVIYNILDEDYSEEEGMTFITMSRATLEKGIGRIVKMATAFKEANKKFIWFICCSLNQADPKVVRMIKSIPELIIIEPSAYNKMLIKGCDYLVQLSDTESFCYSAYEALQRGVPVILTDFPEAKNIVDNGENGYIVKKDLSDLNIDLIFNHKPKSTYYIDRCNCDKWEQVFKGEL